MTYNIKSLVERLRKAVELYDTLMSTVTGCTDGGCMIRAPQGMHTNGGCRCHRDSMKTQRVLYSAKQLREAIDIDAIERAAAPVADSAMAKFAGLILKDHRNDGYPGDVDGGLIQQWALDCGLIEERTVTERCGENCSCAEFVGVDEWIDGVKCYFTTEAGKAAIAASAEKGGAA